MKITVLILALVLMLIAGTALAGSGWDSDYDVRYTITITDSCNHTTTVYNNCFLTNQGQTHISFVPDQMRGGITTGQVVHVNTINGCVSVDRVEAD